MKKVLSAILALALLLTLAPMALADSEAYPVEGGNIYIDWSTGTLTDADESITAAVIPNGVTSIEDYAFLYCTNLTSVIIPDSVISIGDEVFSGCINLEEILVDSGNTIYISNDGVLFTYNGKVLHTYPAGKSNKTYSVPDSVTSIGAFAFHSCGLTSVVIPDSVTNISNMAFFFCPRLKEFIVDDGNTSFAVKEGVLFSVDGKTLIAYPAGMQNESYTIPSGTMYIENGAFSASSLTNIIIQDGIISIGDYTFLACDSLSSITLSNSITEIGFQAFDYCDSLKDVYYSGSEEQWAKINIENYNDPLKSATIHYNSTGPADTVEPSDYLYDTPDPGEGVGDLPEYTAENVTSEATAVEAVEGLAEAMTNEQKQSATGIDLATLLAETAAAKAASQSVTGKEIIINKANVAPLAEKAGSAVDAVDAALVSGGITTARYLSNTVILTSTETGEITIKIDPDILETEVDKVRVETPNYAMTFKIADIEEDLTDIVTIKASSVGTTVSGGGATARMGTVLMRTLAPSNNSTSVKLDVQNGKLRGPVTISLPDDDGDDSGDTTVSKSDGSAVSSKYNPATSTMDGKVTESGTYTVTTNTKDFTDISSKSQEMQTAIKYLASKGIINGTSETTFSPDGEITRAEVAALLVRSLGKLDASAKSTFDDVKSSDWFYATAASSAKCGYIKGYDDNTFKGKNQILKQETVTVVSRVLQTEMGYKLPTDTAQYLAKYSDTLPNWAKPDIALATRENLVVYRVDGTFSGAKTITRGDAAIILYRMFQKIW